MAEVQAGEMKEVYFDIFCKLCEHKDLPESDSPCSECLEIGGRENSHTPEYYKRKED